MKRLFAAALCVALAAPAGAQSVESFFAQARALQANPAPSPAIPTPPATRALRAPAAPETAAPDAYDDNDAFRAKLLDPKNSDRWSVPTELGGILLVVQKGYIDDARLDQLCADLQEAVASIPKIVGRAPLVTKRFTVYVYDDGPISEADVPGAQHGERGLMLAWVKENQEPLFHEMTHLLAGYSDSQSLGEGIAEWVQDKIRPGKANGFIDAGANPDALSKAALGKWPAAFRTTIGAPGYWFKGSNKDIRFDFYYCSWSFTGYLLRHGDMKAFWSVADAGGKPEAYRGAYNASYKSLVADWIRGVGAR